MDPLDFPQGYRPSSEWLTNWYRHYPQLQEGPVLTLPGRLSRLKGHEAFIELIARLRAEGHPVHGLIVGGIEPRRQAYANDLQRKVHALGLSDAVLFIGHRADIREIYAVSTLVLSLSTKPESFGRTVLEALSLGRPVVAYAQGGVGEILDRLYPVGRVPPDDTAALFSRVSALLETAPPVPSESAFPLQGMLDETLALYTALHQAPRSGS